MYCQRSQKKKTFINISGRKLSFFPRIFHLFMPHQLSGSAKYFHKSFRSFNFNQKSLMNVTEHLWDMCLFYLGNRNVTNSFRPASFYKQLKSTNQRSLWPKILSNFPDSHFSIQPVFFYTVFLTLPRFFTLCSFNVKIHSNWQH